MDGEGESRERDLSVIALAPRAELESFIHRTVPIAAVSRRMLKSRTFGYVTAALPGLEAFLMLERLRLMAGRAAPEDRFVVVDAPATGHALELLAVARSIMQLAPAGTLNRLAHAVGEFLRDSARFGVIVTLNPRTWHCARRSPPLPRCVMKLASRPLRRSSIAFRQRSFPRPK